MGGLPILYSTGISTYLWILNNNKVPSRKGKIQLIDASDMYEVRRKNLGRKRVDISDVQMDWICKTYIDGNDHGKSVIVPVEEFMYRRITTLRPLRQAILLDDDKKKIAMLMQSTGVKGLTDANKKILQEYIYEKSDEIVVYKELDDFVSTIRSKFEKQKKLVTNKQLFNAMISVYGVKDSSYDICLDKNGDMVPDPELKDYEDIPYLEEIDSYMQREVLPYAPDTWIDMSVTDSGEKMAGMGDDKVGLVGTKISFNNYFYHYDTPRKPREIADEILELENGLESFMEGFLK
ncbi:hypothetical protein [Butyrivibrio sp. WCD3002]|uniref:hypothetical protein n=1 Tax=Butyrivibrio sp. WCD3002 TaxID=1280676 RepID=UPI00041E9E6B|nr:hypothetical protein [Butyrivibrio sp. WCD3002]